MPIMMTKFDRALKKFQAASEELAFAGAGHPDDIPGLEQDYTHAHETLRNIVLDIVRTANNKQGVLNAIREIMRKGNT